jgi:anti-sigma B factor antagonist
MYMKVTERQVGAVTILDLTGNLTIDHFAERLKDRTTTLIKQGQINVLVNLADVPYIDSGGLGQLVASYTSIAKAGGSMKLLHANAKNQHLLVITRLATVFDTFESEDEAVASFQQPRKDTLAGSPS